MNNIQTDEIEIVNIREIPYDYAKLEINKYIQRTNGRKVYISELAIELRLDIELIAKIIEETQMNKKVNNIVSEKYNTTAIELLKRLREHKDRFNLNCVDFKAPFPYDQFAEVNKEIKDIVKDIEIEYNYEMSEYQCSWAVTQLIIEEIQINKKVNKT